MDTKMLYQQALLAEAAYANFSNVSNEQSYVSALRTAGFSEAQAEEFVANWSIVSHQPNTDSGFSATLFQRIPLIQ